MSIVDPIRQPSLVRELADMKRRLADAERALATHTMGGDPFGGQCGTTLDLDGTYTLVPDLSFTFTVPREGMTYFVMVTLDISLSSVSSTATVASRLLLDGDPGTYPLITFRVSSAAGNGRGTQSQVYSITPAAGSRTVAVQSRISSGAATTAQVVTGNSAVVGFPIQG